MDVTFSKVAIHRVLNKAFESKSNVLRSNKTRNKIVMSQTYQIHGTDASSDVLQTPTPLPSKDSNFETETEK